jgi:predicted N-acetyltransferase YhbS
MDFVISVRQETKDDIERVYQVIQEAFASVEISDHKEQFTVAELRDCEEFIPEFSLVAEVNGEIVGHILLTKVSIIGELREIPSLALAPLSVIPNFQRIGVGTKLVKAAHDRAIELGYKSVIVLGMLTIIPSLDIRSCRHGGSNFLSMCRKSTVWELNLFLIL